MFFVTISFFKIKIKQCQTEIAGRASIDRSSTVDRSYKIHYDMTKQKVTMRKIDYTSIGSCSFHHKMWQKL